MNRCKQGVSILWILPVLCCGKELPKPLNKLANGCLPDCPLEPLLCSNSSQGPICLPQAFPATEISVVNTVVVWSLTVDQRYLPLLVWRHITANSELIEYGTLWVEMTSSQTNVTLQMTEAGEYLLYVCYNDGPAFLCAPPYSFTITLDTESQSKTPTITPSPLPSSTPPEELSSSDPVAIAFPILSALLAPFLLFLGWMPWKSVR